MRRHRREDAQAISEALADWEVARWLARLPIPYTLADAVSWIRTTNRNWNHGVDYQFVVALQADDRLLGHMGIRMEPGDAEGEFGYWFDRRAWGQGYASEAGAEVLRFAFDELAVQRVTAVILPGNARSVRVAQKLGMKPAGHRRQRFDPIDATVDAPVFALSRQDWLGRRVPD
ncbi:MAG: GNAT family N-acetyltransferase [Pseudomonadota bacterium]